MMISVFSPPKLIPQDKRTDSRTHWFPSYPKHKETTWTALCKALTRFRIAGSKLDVGYWSPAKYKPDTKRQAKNVESVSCLVWDYDDGTTIENALQPWLDYALAIHTSFSHTDKKPRFRIVVPLSEPVPGFGWLKFWSFHYNRLEVKPDQSCKDPSRLYHFPSHPPGAESYAAMLDGDLLPVNSAIWTIKERKPEPPHTPLNVRHRFKNLYGESEQARSELGQRLGAQAGDAGLMAKITCPNCKKKTVFFYTDPFGQMKGARCQHRNSCGWFGWLEDLER